MTSKKQQPTPALVVKAKIAHSHHIETSNEIKIFIELLLHLNIKVFFFFNDCHQPWSMNSHSWGCLQAAAPSQKSTAGCSLLFPIIAKLWLHLTLVSYITQPFIIAGNPFLKPRPTQQKYVASPPKLIWFKVSRIDSWRFCTTHTIFLLGDPELLWLDSSGLSPPSWSCQSAAGHNPSW